MSSEAQETPQVEQQAREITLWSTKNNRKAKLTSTAKTWGELKKEISKNTDFDINGLLATENQKRTDLANEAAILPETPFVIYFRAKETKSGNTMSYKDLRGAIKTLIEQDGDAAKAHFNCNDKNYTTKGTEELRALYISYKPAKTGKGKAKPEVAEAVEETANVAEVVETVAVAKKLTVQDRLGIIRENLVAIKDTCGDSNVDDRVELVSDEIDGLESELIEGGYAEATSEEVAKETPAPVEEPKESEEEKIAREKREADAAENAELEREARELSGGFKK